MRYVVILVVGVLIGAIAATTGASILARRNPYPKALMTVMKHELAAASRAASEPDCTQSGPALQKLTLLAEDIGTAMPDEGSPDRVFQQYIGNLGKQIDVARQSACPERSLAVTGIKNACDECHRDYR